MNYSKKKYILIHLLLTFILLTYYLFIINLTNIENSHGFIISFIYILMMVWVIYTAVKLEKDIITPYLGFVIVYFLFNGSLSILVLLDKIIGDYFFIVTDSLRNKSLMMSLVGLVVLHLIYLIVIQTNNKNTLSEEILIGNKNYFLVGIILLIISFVPYLIYFINISLNIHTYGYREGAFNLEIPSIIIKLKDLYFLSIYILIVNCKNIKNALILSLFVLIPASYLFLLGVRGDNAFTIFATLWLLSYLFKLSTKKKILILMSIMMIVITTPYIAEIRDNVNDSVDVSVFDFGILDLIEETGSSMYTISYTILFIDSGALELTYGLPYIQGILYLLPIPFISDLLGGEIDILGKELSNILKSSFGVGSSIIAESYMNFSYLGPILVMLIFAFLFIFFYIKSKKNIILLPLFCAMLPRIMFWSRSEFMPVFRNIFWYIIFPCMIYMALKIILNRRKLKL